MNANLTKHGHALIQKIDLFRSHINYPVAMMFVLALICSVFSAIAIVFKAVMFLVPAIMLAGTVVFFLVLKNKELFFSRSYSWLLLAIFFGSVISQLLARMSPLALQNVTDLILYTSAIGFVFAAWPYISQSKVLCFAFLILILMWILQLASSLYGRSEWFSAVYQFGYNLKWPLMFISGFAIVWDRKLESKVWIVLLGFSFVLLFFTVLQILAPSLLNNLFSYSNNSYGGESNPFIPLIKRLGGFYTLSSNTAAVASVGFIFLLAGWLRYRKIVFIYGIAAFGLVLICTGQRNELMALIISVVIFFLLYVQRPTWQKLLFSILGLILVGLTIYLLADKLHLDEVLRLWGITGTLYQLTDRVALTVHGYEVAQQYFPLGAGLGTYGGVAAMKFDPSLYDDLGFARYYYWYRQGLFLMDTYWPNIYAEGGLFAAYALLLIFGLILLYSYQLKTPTIHAKAHRAAAFSILIYMLLNTISSTVITDPKFSWMAWLSFGWAAYLSTPAIKKNI
ncbi:hypothetical protein HZU75_14005 [Chitinibacter fontanus]|uniref:O-antigen ligase family protein n=1 Tax=Chitinibacter fontanus TaxID=1737446 RepID=A0A7D5ZM15_9NEIS|nr:hypothetical protein [Chitinibacter fontanus]QLI82550.1 hypothetical protein HZU75_14005 [Chitinibacter fontanus]